MKTSESKIQIALFEWAAKQRLSELKHPVIPGAYLVDYMYAVPNGGKRNAREASRMKREGVKAGVPDVCITLGCAGYYGLYIELKRDKPKGRLTMGQKAWLKKLNKAHYFGAVCFGLDEAIDLIKAYLGQERQILESLKYC